LFMDQLAVLLCLYYIKRVRDRCHWLIVGRSGQ
jgi:hypothetical protein